MTTMDDVTKQAQLAGEALRASMQGMNERLAVAGEQMGAAVREASKQEAEALRKVMANLGRMAA